VFLYNCHIATYEQANRFNHEPTRPRKLLLHRKEIRKIIGKIKMKGYTLIALSMYFNNKNRIKIELGLAKGKKQHDKREALKQADWKREQSRLLKER
jgi:SsrA-binding protein